MVERILNETGLDPYWLDLELTETAMMEDSAVLARNLRDLAELGVGCAIDDFGTGYSSLSYLAGLPLKILKIDGSFIERIGWDHKTEALTRGIISMARSLGLGVTAEKVETVEQLDFLQAERCDRIQGYLASRPVDADAMARILRSGVNLLPEASTYARRAGALREQDDVSSSLDRLARLQRTEGYSSVH